MKTKFTPVVFRLFCLISLIFFTSCQKEKQDSASMTFTVVDSSAKRINSNNGQKSANQYAFVTRAGHSKESCNGLCGSSHKNCQGSGRACSLDWSMAVSPIKLSSFNSPKNSLNEYIYEGVAFYPEDISDEESFDMPARSFDLENEAIWINIPEQTLERDSQTLCFIVKNITFTDSPKYINK